MDLPVLIPRVKKRPSPRDPRGVVRETTPSNANKRRCRAGRVRLCPLPTFSGRFRFRGESRRRSSTLAAAFGGALRAVHMPTKSAALLRSITIAGEIAALFLPAQSAISQSYFRFELRARADSPLPRQFARLRGRGDLRSLRWWRAVRGDAEAGTLKVPRRTNQ